MKSNILIIILNISIFLFGCLNVSNKRDNKDKKKIDIGCQFNSLKETLQSLGICLNIDEQKWLDTLNLNSEIAIDWRYFCDTTYFKIYKMSNQITCENLFLLEVRINYGSGEYDNYIIKKEEYGYQIITEFKGYLYEIITSNDDYFKFTYQFNVSPDERCLVTGKFNGKQIRTNTILNKDIAICQEVFIKGNSW